MFFWHRSYEVSSMAMNKSEAYDFCEAQGLGLAIWDNAESYEDMKYLGKMLHNLYNTVSHDTSLDNENKEVCNTNLNQSCDGKLIWRQTKNGPCQMFQANALQTR